jgi:tRNA (guanine-N7-)-methyltransferase
MQDDRNNKIRNIPRIRHHVKPNLYFPLDKLNTPAENYPSVPAEIHWENYFINQNPPDVLDIGTGFGKYLIEYSSFCKNENILGVEIRTTAVKWLQSIIKSEGIGNAACIWYSAVNKFPFIREESIKKIFYLFPDPWIKRKHNKRRIINSGMIAEFLRILKQDGIVHIKTDVKELHEYHLNSFSQNENFRLQSEDAVKVLKIESSREEFCVLNNIKYYEAVFKKI